MMGLIAVIIGVLVILTIGHLMAWVVSKSWWHFTGALLAGGAIAVCAGALGWAS